jgi:hypothetical protein
MDGLCRVSVLQYFWLFVSVRYCRFDALVLKLVSIFFTPLPAVLFVWKFYILELGSATICGHFLCGVNFRYHLWTHSVRS